MDWSEVIAHIDGALLAIGLPEVMISAPMVLVCALGSVFLGDIAKGMVRRGADTPSERRALRALIVLLGCALGMGFCLLGKVTIFQGLLLGLAGGGSAPFVWRAVVPWLRARGVR